MEGEGDHTCFSNLGHSRVEQGGSFTLPVSARQTGRYIYIFEKAKSPREAMDSIC
jgi:hypothetical protein